MISSVSGAQEARNTEGLEHVATGNVEARKSLTVAGRWSVIMSQSSSIKEPKDERRRKAELIAPHAGRRRMWTERDTRTLISVHPIFLALGCFWRGFILLLGVENTVRGEFNRAGEETSGGCKCVPDGAWAGICLRQPHTSPLSVLDFPTSYR